VRVAMLAKGWSGYLDAPFRRLADRGVELLVCYPRSNPDTGFSPYAVHEYAQALPWTDVPPVADVVQAVTAFAPDAVITHSWEMPGYRATLRTLPPEVLRVVMMDNVWRGTPKQWAGMATSRFYLHPLFEVAMVPSERTEFFAHRLGFPPDRIIRGALTADTGTFHSGPRTGVELAGRRRFLSALRLVHHKGADVLAEAYAGYRSLVEDPWQLDVIGMGPMREHFRDIPGVVMHGFRQPDELAELMRESSCYVNPSRIDPYAVVLHEATSSGLPVLTSDYVGAAPTMVQDGYNGWMVARERPDLLAEAMARMSTVGAERLEEMSAISRNLATRLSPEGWARNLHEELERRLGRTDPAR
jgi:glycosyltransferase involved in cell wall biosynthesis